MRHIIYIYTLIVLLCAGFSSCSDTDTVYYGNVYFHKTGLFADLNGEFPKTMTTTFAQKNVAYLELDEDEDLPTGWSAEIDFYRGLITVTVTEEARTAALAAIDNPTLDYPEDGRVEEISFEGETHDGYSVTAHLTVGVVEFKDLEPEQANSMIVTQPGVFYTFNPTFRGEQSHGSNIGGVDDCELLWKSYVSRILHVQLVDSNQAGFYLSYDTGDYDDDDDYTELIPGNAVIAAHDASDNILWSWHIWITTTDPRADGSVVTFNGKKFLARNLGADMNVMNSVYDDTENVLLSYGLYYQWGRKDPFIQPVDYVASWALDGYMSDHNGNLVTLDYEESTSSVGTISYATENPMTYIMGVKSSSYDWLYSSHDNNLWNDAQKSVYDPSPYGWRVPKSDDFVGASVSDNYVDDGWWASSGALLLGGGSYVDFFGAGYRSFINGRVENLNVLMKNPWSGYYWTSGGSGSSNYSYSLIFSNMYLMYDTTTDILTSYPMQRANGMQIRCVEND